LNKFYSQGTIVLCQRYNFVDGVFFADVSMVIVRSGRGS